MVYDAIMKKAPLQETEIETPVGVDIYEEEEPIKVEEIPEEPVVVQEPVLEDSTKEVHEHKGPCSCKIVKHLANLSQEMQAAT